MENKEKVLNDLKLENKEKVLNYFEKRNNNTNTELKEIKKNDNNEKVNYESTQIKTDMIKSLVSYKLMNCK
jgi:hypothetical protein